MASIVVPHNFNAVEDAESLRKACEGWGTNEKAVVAVLGHRNSAQRKQIRQAYWDLYQEDLVKRLESELNGDFERAVYRWNLEPEDRDAVLANVAMRKSLDYHVLVEIACARSAEELLIIRRAYQARYKRSLEEDVAAHTAGDTRKLLVGLMTAFRYEGAEINAKLAKSEADILQEAIKKKHFNNDEVIRILTTRSKTQLMATFNNFKDDHGSSITKALLGELAENDFKRLMRIAIRCINEPLKYYEKVLRNAIKKVGTDEDAITRVIVTRAEKDLVHIKELYYRRNNVPLDQAVAKETSGDYKAFLLALLGN
ncbi:annexin-like protein RJ4 [Euphorbia lathyris]|uniref:annexin-like protein RJ4 n=1 Tax=Euphorbia lathyris TaxID=212925 RepID=UPI003313303F